MNRGLSILAGCGTLLMAATVIAHDGQSHANDAGVGASSPAWTAPAWTPDGRLYVPKSLQRLLGIRTQVVGREPIILSVPATVSLRPESAGLVQAPEAGRIDSAGRWPVPGQQVRKGEVLAVLSPALSEREQARRRVELAQIEQRRVIARVNVDRMRVQIAGQDGKVAPGNIYYEQAESELRGLDEAHRAKLDGLQARSELRAPVAGRLVEVAVSPGEVVQAGSRMFLVADDGGRHRLELMHTDPRLPGRISRASIPGQSQVRLRLRGREPMRDPPGWRLWVDSEGTEGWLPGQIVDVELSMQPDPEPCVERGGRGEIWLHVAPELFERRPLAGCESEPAVQPGERRVVQGAVLLSDYTNLAPPAGR
ncbi:MAG: hypothetical protein ACT4QA_15595 [Panacagrimonas sp.]